MHSEDTEDMPDPLSLGCLNGRAAPRLGAVLALWIGLVAPGASHAQLTRAVTPAVAAERALLDSYLRPGREVSGTKMQENAFRQAYSSRIRNPFLVMLQNADLLRLTDMQADSIAILNRNYSRVADSAWSPVARYLATLPNDYDVAEAWNRVSAAFTTVIARMLVYAPAAKKLLTAEQVPLLPPSLVPALDTTCIRSLHPASGTAGRIGGAGALGIGRIRGC